MRVSSVIKKHTEGQHTRPFCMFQDFNYSMALNINSGLTESPFSPKLTVYSAATYEPFLITTALGSLFTSPVANQVMPEPVNPSTVI